MGKHIANWTPTMRDWSAGKMRIFTGSDKEIFEAMCDAITLCTESTEMLFRHDDLFYDLCPDKPVFSLEEIAKDAKKNPEKWQ
jgi:hypothetical protein